MHGDFFVGHTAARSGSAQAGGQEQRHHFGGQAAGSWSGRQRDDLLGEIAGFLEQFTPGRLAIRFSSGLRFIAHDARGQLDDPGMAGDTVLLDEQQIAFRRHGRNDGGPRRFDPFRVFPVAFANE